ncbi:MAG: Dna2/Cas4 domain-containing protein, partial [Dehalococcoidia bacterium]|nr:Dna2/Cas4 domain-containing protein [Dehalococcoidia bacterium]
MYSEDDLLPISALAQFAYCERRAALVLIEGLWEDNVFTAEGELLHERTHQESVESRHDLRLARGLWLRSFKLGVYGRADVVELRQAGDAGAVV